MNKNEAIQMVREELIKTESEVFDQVSCLQHATCKTILDEISSGQDIKTNLFMVEVNDITSNLKKLKDLRHTLTVLEGIE
jgi:hypothetical protein